MEFNHSDYRYTDLLKSYEQLLKVKSDDGCINLPAAHGEGYMYAAELGSGISVLIAERNLKVSMMTQRKARENFEFFILRIHDASNQNSNQKPQEEDFTEALQVGTSMAQLTASHISTNYFLPAGIKIRSVNIIFDKLSLLNFLDIETVEKFIHIYFSFHLQKTYVASIDAEYRAILNELTRDLKQHPMRKAFIQNRIMLILEKFLIQFITKDHQNKKTIQLKDSEINRLIKAEVSLLKDFTTTPPTIEKLSRLCAMSPTKFKNDFKTLYGLPLYEYYQKNRMMHARSLILEGKYAIKEVGNMIGYRNLGHFAAGFKKEFGVLPRELMNANQFTKFIPEDASANITAKK